MDFRIPDDYCKAEVAMHKIIVDTITRFDNKSLNGVLRHLPKGLRPKLLFGVLSSILEISQERCRSAVNQKYKRRKK